MTTLRQSAEIWSTVGNAERTLPFVSHWNTGQKTDGFTPAYQISLINKGYPILPWLQLPVPGKPLGWNYYKDISAFLRLNQLPFTLVSTQWERLLVEDKTHFDVMLHRAPGSPDNAPVLIPTGPEKDWYRAGILWSETPELKKLIEAYPNPPFVVFLSNNEQRKQRWNQLSVRQGLRGDSVKIKQQQYENWKTHYEALFRGLKSGLGTASWQKASRVIGYNNYAPTFMGRWPDWIKYSRRLGNNVDPLITTWDGSSIPFYLHNWNSTNDYSELSPQVEAMGWYPALEQLLNTDTKHWFELSLWDGYSPNPSKDKRQEYAAQKQTFSPARYKGLVRYGMWLTRPRVVREFRHWNQAMLPVRPYFQVVLESAREVHSDDILSSFWLNGELLVNSVRHHPYSYNLSPDVASMQRWFGHADENHRSTVARRSLDKKTIPVFDILMKLPDQQDYLIFAYCPTGKPDSTIITIPGVAKFTVKLSTEGTFHHVTRDHGIWKVERIL